MALSSDRFWSASEIQGHETPSPYQTVNGFIFQGARNMS
jgi:hypothetical protein